MRLETRRASGNAEPTLQNSGSSAARFVMGLLEKEGLNWAGVVSNSEVGEERKDWTKGFHIEPNGWAYTKPW